MKNLYDEWLGPNNLYTPEQKEQIFSLLYILYASHFPEFATGLKIDEAEEERENLELAFIAGNHPKQADLQERLKKLIDEDQGIGNLEDLVVNYLDAAAKQASDVAFAEGFLMNRMSPHRFKVEDIGKLAIGVDKAEAMNEILNLIKYLPDLDVDRILHRVSTLTVEKQIGKDWEKEWETLKGPKK